MKSFFLSLLFISSVSFAQEVVIFEKPTFKICGKMSLGCATRLVTQDGKSFLVDTRYVQDFLKKHNSSRHNEDMTYISVNEIVGVVTLEDGRFPNPTVPFSVIRVISLVE